MEAILLINLFIFLPLLGFIGCLLIEDKEKNEHSFSGILQMISIVLFVAGLVLIGIWIKNGFNAIHISEQTLYKSESYEFLFSLYFDELTAVFMFVGTVITLTIGRYSGYYMHRENGYKRFFVTVLLFYTGYNIAIFSGNFETLFIGWEILGLTSFLLIAFYRYRYLPVKNGVRIFGIYRIGDVGILMAMWAMHHLWHENINFMKLSNYELIQNHLSEHKWLVVFISVMILVAASAKSAQLPFSSWLPRAMEGPTPSSAIFYGSLSVHIGVFLLIRTFPFWENVMIVRIIIAVLGIATLMVTQEIARAQSNIKSQIAYASASQIGLMFVEIAFGLKYLALLHFAGNAFLRAYQLLVSPSVVSYLLREQMYDFQSKSLSIEEKLPDKLKIRLYLLGIKEFNLDSIQSKLIFSTIKNWGRSLNFLHINNILYFFIPLYIGSLYIRFNEQLIPEEILNLFPFVFSFLALLMIMRAFAERYQPILAWVLIFLNHFWTSLAISFNEDFNWKEIGIYLSGVIMFGLYGYYILIQLRKREPHYFSLNQFYGHVYEYKALAIKFLISCLGLMGFPITYTFIGEDLLYSHIKTHEYYLAFFTASGYIISGIALIRIYARLFLGNHVKTYHPTPIKTA